MVKNLTNNNIYASYLAPSPNTVTYWADLTTDPTGGTIKVFGANGGWSTMTDESADHLKGGKANQILTKASDADDDFVWLDPDASSQIQSNWGEIDDSKVDYIKNKPSLAQVATSGSYTDLTDKPVIPVQVNADWAAVSGMAEILNKPTIPAAQVNSDWSAVGTVAEILNKPTLATVATTGNYNDLTNKPTIPAAPGTLFTDINDTVPVPTAPESLANAINLHRISKTGDYYDLLNTPIIPAAQIPSDWFKNAVGSDVDRIVNRPRGIMNGADGKIADVMLLNSLSFSNGPSATNYKLTTNFSSTNTSNGIVGQTTLDVPFSGPYKHGTIRIGTGLDINATTGIATVKLDATTPHADNLLTVSSDGLYVPHDAVKADIAYVDSQIATASLNTFKREYNGEVGIGVSVIPDGSAPIVAGNEGDYFFTLAFNDQPDGLPMGWIIIAWQYYGGSWDFSSQLLPIAAIDLHWVAVKMGSEIGGYYVIKSGDTVSDLPQWELLGAAALVGDNSSVVVSNDVISVKDEGVTEAKLDPTYVESNERIVNKTTEVRGLDAATDTNYPTELAVRSAIESAEPDMSSKQNKEWFGSRADFDAIATKEPATDYHVLDEGPDKDTTVVHIQPAITLTDPTQADIDALGRFLIGTLTISFTGAVDYSSTGLYISGFSSSDPSLVGIIANIDGNVNFSSQSDKRLIFQGNNCVCVLQSSSDDYVLTGSVLFLLSQCSIAETGYKVNVSNVIMVDDASAHVNNCSCNVLSFHRSLVSISGNVVANSLNNSASISNIYDRVGISIGSITNTGTIVDNRANHASDTFIRNDGTYSPTAVFNTVPDYDNREGTNRITALNTGWTVLKDGYVDVNLCCSSASASSNDIAIRINGVNYFRDAANGGAAQRMSIGDIIPVREGDLIYFYANSGVTNLSDSTWCYFIPPKYVLVKDAVIDTTTEVNWNKHFIGQPDYSNQEGTNRLPTGTLTWPCNRDGYVHFTGASASSSMRGAFYINGVSVYTPIPDARIENIIVPISKGDIASRNADEYWLSSNMGSCYFIPPKDVPQLVVKGADLISSTALNELYIDPTTKIGTINGLIASDPMSLTASTTCRFKGSTKYLELGYNAGYVDNSYTQFYHGEGAGEGSNNFIVFRLHEFDFNNSNTYVTWLIKVQVTQVGAVSAIDITLETTAAYNKPIPLPMIISVGDGTKFDLYIAKYLTSDSNAVARAIELVTYDEVSPNDHMVKLLNVVGLTPTTTSTPKPNGVWGYSTDGNSSYAYHIDHPDNWTSGIEYNFGNNLYGKNLNSAVTVATCNLASNASQTVSLITFQAGMTKLVKHQLEFAIDNNVDFNELGTCPSYINTSSDARCTHSRSELNIYVTNHGGTALSGLAIKLKGWALYKK
jgi:hypothetical protein